MGAWAGRSPPTGVNGEEQAARSFARAWRRLTGAAGEISSRLRLFRLDALTEPAPAPHGRPRIATDDDTALLVGWFDKFAEEVRELPATGHEHTVSDRLSYRGLTLWETPDGEPVSLAALTRQEAGMVRIGPVYTPRRHRGNGYAGAVTAEATRLALAAGAEEVLLFTDLANPTSNALYPRIGYRPVEEKVVIGFQVTR